MIDRDSRVAVTRQAELLDLSRSSVYYTPRALSDRDLRLMRLMRRIDELHLQMPFYGSRKLTRERQKEGHDITTGSSPKRPLACVTCRARQRGP